MIFLLRKRTNRPTTDSAQQSKKPDATARFIRLFNEFPEAHQEALLTMMETWLEWLHTVHTEHTKHTEQRKHPRRPCFMAVDYGTADHVSRDFIRNISAGGVYVETPTPLPVARQIILAFSSPKYEAPIKTTGEVAWSGSRGIGVEFDMEHRHLVPMIRALYGPRPPVAP